MKKNIIVLGSILMISNLGFAFNSHDFLRKLPASMNVIHSNIHTMSDEYEGVACSDNKEHSSSCSTDNDYLELWVNKHSSL